MLESSKFLSLEHKLFRVISMVIFTLMLISTAESIMEESPLWIIIPNFIVSLLGLFFFLFSKTNSGFERLRYLLIFFLILAIGYFWFTVGGVYGSSGIAGLAIGFIIIIISKPQQRKVLLGIYIAFLIFLTLSQKFTDWVAVEPHIYNSIFLDYVLFGTSTLLVIYYLKSRFDQERALNMQQKKQLEKVNSAYKSALVEKDQAIQELTQTQSQLIESEKLASVGKLTAGLAHELNNPLNYIGGIVKPIERDLEEINEVLTESQRERLAETLAEIRILLSHVSQGTSKASDLLKSLVTMTPTSFEQKNVAFVKLDITVILKAIASTFQNDHPSIHFNFYLQKDLYVKGDHQQLTNIFAYILKNAIQAIPPTREGSLDIKATENNRSVVIQFTDNGEGIKSTLIPKIFDPFFTTRQEKGNSGLGLYMSHSLIKNHNGEIKIESDEGMGTTVTLYFPSYS